MLKNRKLFKWYFECGYKCTFVVLVNSSVIHYCNRDNNFWQQTANVSTKSFVCGYGFAIFIVLFNFGEFLENNTGFSELRFVDMLKNLKTAVLENGTFWKVLLNALQNADICYTHEKYYLLEFF